MKKALGNQLEEAGFDMDVIERLLDDTAADKSDILQQPTGVSPSPSHEVNQLIDRLFAYKEDHKRLVEQIVSSGSVVIPELLRACHEREFTYVQNQVDTARNTARWITKSAVEIAKNEHDPLVRDDVMMKIIAEMAVHVKWQVEVAIPHLIELIDAHDFNLHFAVDALVKMGNVNAVLPLLNSLENARDDDTRANIIWALGQFRDPRAIPKLIEWVATHQDDMRAAAVQSLGNIGHPDAIPVLESCLKDPTVLHRQDMGGTFWIFRTFRGRKICDFAFKSLQQIGTPEALSITTKWQPPSTWRNPPDRNCYCPSIKRDSSAWRRSFSSGLSSAGASSG